MNDYGEIGGAILALIVLGLFFLMLNETLDTEIGVNLTLIGVLFIIGAILIGIAAIIAIVNSIAESV